MRLRRGLDRARHLQGRLRCSEPPPPPTGAGGGSRDGADEGDPPIAFGATRWAGPEKLSAARRGSEVLWREARPDTGFGRLAFSAPGRGSTGPELGQRSNGKGDGRRRRRVAVALRDQSPFPRPEVTYDDILSASAEQLAGLVSVETTRSARPARAGREGGGRRQRTGKIPSNDGSALAAGEGRRGEPRKRPVMGRDLRYREALGPAALREELRRDDRVLLWARTSGVFGGRVQRSPEGPARRSSARRRITRTTRRFSENTIVGVFRGVGRGRMNPGLVPVSS